MNIEWRKVKNYVIGRSEEGSFYYFFIANSQCDMQRFISRVSDQAYGFCATGHDPDHTEVVRRMWAGEDPWCPGMQIIKEKEYIEFFDRALAKELL